jgi:adenylate cyclase
VPGTQARQVAVLFANISGGTSLFEYQGEEAAREFIARVVDQLRRSVESSTGRVVKTIGDGIMAAFPTPDAAAIAAGSMQYAIDALPPVGDARIRIGVRIGFHYGPVIQTGEDIFGDTVNLASRLTKKAGPSHIITSRETSEQLGPMFRNSRRPLYAIHVKGRPEEVEVCELIWNQAADVTPSAASRASADHDRQVLSLKYRYREVYCRRHIDLIMVGRDADCDLVVDNKNASRHHCTIERRQGKFILADHSANGTYVMVEGGSEILLRREELPLAKRGCISFGQPCAEAEVVAQYSCS